MPSRRQSRSSKKRKITSSTFSTIKTPTPTSLPLSILPNEVLSIIINHLAYIHRPSLSRLSRTSRQMYDLAAPLLYKKIILGLDPDKDSRRDCHYKASKGPRPNLDTRKWKLLAGAEQVTVHPHSSTSCQSSRTSKFDNVKTLRLEIDGESDAVSNCVLYSFFHDDWRLYYGDTCKIVTQLRPKKLVVRAGCLIHFAKLQNCLPSVATSAVQDFVSILTDERPYDRFRFQIQHVENIKRFVIIVQTVSPEEKARIYFESVAVAISEAIISMYSKSAVDFIIVNAAGLIDPANLDSHDVEGIVAKNPNLTPFEHDQLAQQQHFSETFWELFGKAHDYFCVLVENADEEMERSFNVKFMTMRDYIENEDWSGEFEYNEIKPWLRQD